MVEGMEWGFTRSNFSESKSEKPLGRTLENQKFGYANTALVFNHITKEFALSPNLMGRISCGKSESKILLVDFGSALMMAQFKTSKLAERRAKKTRHSRVGMRKTSNEKSLCLYGSRKSSENFDACIATCKILRLILLLSFADSHYADRRIIARPHLLLHSLEESVRAFCF